MTDASKYFADMPTDPTYLRKIAAGTKPEHIVMDIDFALLTDVLADFGIGNLYDFVTKDGIDDKPVNQALDRLATLITSQGLPLGTETKLQGLWDYLAEDEGQLTEPADIIFVFGGPEDIKAQKAAELYLAGKAPKIIFTGDIQRKLQLTPHISESVRDAKTAKFLGVPDNAILIEDTSVNTPENVQNAITILSDLKPFPTSFILVNLPWYLRRATNTFKTYWRNAPVPYSRIQRVNAGSGQFNRDNYFLQRRGLEYVIFEYLKIKMARDMGHM